MPIVPLRNCKNVLPFSMPFQFHLLALLDRVDVFLKSSTALTEDEVHPDLPYDVHQCQPLADRRLTR